MFGWVILSNTWLELSVETLRAEIDAIFPGEFLPPREQGSFVIDGAVEGAQFMINSAVARASGTFMLHNVPGPYTDFSEFADHIRDPVLRAAATTQQCWLGIDYLAGAQEEAFRFIGKVLAALAPADSAALVEPNRLITWAFDEDIRRQLGENGVVETMMAKQ